MKHDHTTAQLSAERYFATFLQHTGSPGKVVHKGPRGTPARLQRGYYHQYFTWYDMRGNRQSHIVPLTKRIHEILAPIAEIFTRLGRRHVLAGMWSCGQGSLTLQEIDQVSRSALSCKGDHYNPGCTCMCRRGVEQKKTNIIETSCTQDAECHGTGGGLC